MTEGSGPSEPNPSLFAYDWNVVLRRFDAIPAKEIPPGQSAENGVHQVADCKNGLLNRLVEAYVFLQRAKNQPSRNASRFAFLVVSWLQIQCEQGQRRIHLYCLNTTQ